jgi:hypothetical protein
MPPLGHSRHRRRRGLERLSRLTGWLTGAALVGCGAFAALLARPATSTATPPSTPVSPATVPGTSLDDPATTPTTSLDPAATPATTPATSPNNSYAAPSVSPAPQPRLRPSHHSPQSSSGQGVVSSGAS